MWICFIMEDEMTIVIVLPIGGRIFIIHDCCTSIGAITNCQMILQKIKIMDDETNVEKRWNDIIVVYIFNLYEKE